MAIAVFVWAVQRPAQAGTISITNPSFEQPPLSQDSGLGGNNPSFFALTGWHATNVVVPADTGIWHYSPSPSGVYDDPIPDGVQTAYSYGYTGALWQATAKTFLPSEDYTLTVSIGQWKSVPFAPAQIRLYAGSDGTTLANNTLLKSVSISGPGAGKWAPYSLNFGSNDVNYASLLAANQGQPLIVAFYANAPNNGSNEADFDNVQFSFVPEPGALWLLSLGAVLMWRRRRQTRS